MIFVSGYDPATGDTQGGDQMAEGATDPAPMVRPLLWISTGLAVLVMALTGLVFWLGGQVDAEKVAATDRQAALEAAGRHAVTLVSLNYKTAGADVQRILDTSTGAARAVYAAGAAKLKETAVANKVVQDGALRATGLVSMEGGVAKVLVVADMVIAWEGTKIPPQDRFYRWSMDVTKTGGSWLVSRVEQVQ